MQRYILSTVYGKEIYFFYPDKTKADLLIAKYLEIKTNAFLFAYRAGKKIGQKYLNHPLKLPNLISFEAIFCVD